MDTTESGRRGSPAIVFLHGAGASGRMWRLHTASLAERFHCLAPDLPGFGQSSHLPPVSRSATADLVARLIEERVPARKAHVVGLSWGGGVAHAVIEHHAELVDHAVIDGAGMLAWWANPLFLTGISLITPFLHTRPVGRLLGGYVGMDETGRGDLRLASRRAFRRAFIDGFRVRPSWTEMRASCPTLLVAGEHETVVRRSNAAQASLMPAAQAVYVPGGRHAWLGRQPELHRHMVEAWITDQPLPAALVHEPADTAAEARMEREMDEERRDAGYRPATRRG